MTKHSIPEIGHRFGYLVVEGQQGTKVLCRCECGYQKSFPRSALWLGLNKTCGRRCKMFDRSSPERKCSTCGIMKNSSEFDLRGRRCKECKGVANREYYEANREVLIRKSAAKGSEWYHNNKEHAKQYRQAYYQENKKRIIENQRELSRSRRARKAINGGSHNRADIEVLYCEQRGECASCKKSIRPVDGCRGYHADHIMPIVLGGSNDISNIQLLCPSCNLSKKSLHPEEWSNRNSNASCAQ